MVLHSPKQRNVKELHSIRKAQEGRIKKAMIVKVRKLSEVEMFIYAEKYMDQKRKLEEWLTQKFHEALANHVDEVILKGDGV